MYREIRQTDLSEFHSKVWEKSPKVSTKYILLCCMAIIAIFLYRISLKNSLRVASSVREQTKINKTSVFAIFSSESPPLSPRLLEQSYPHHPLFLLAIQIPPYIAHSPRLLLKRQTPVWLGAGVASLKKALTSQSLCETIENREVCGSEFDARGVAVV